MSGRRVGVYGGLMLATVAAGLAVRFARLGLPWGVMKYGGSMLWALMIYWVLAAVLRGRRPAQVSLSAGVAATAVEFLKLYRVGWLDAFRQTLPGILLLGKYFSMWDILAYWIAIGVGAAVDSRLVRRAWG